MRHARDQCQSANVTSPINLSCSFLSLVSRHLTYLLLLLLTRQFTLATHCNLSRTKIIWLFNREGTKKQFCIVGCYTHYKLMIGYVLSREGKNSRCRRFDRTCRRSCCRRSDGPLAITRDHSMLSPLSSLPFRLVGGDEPWRSYRRHWFYSIDHSRGRRGIRYSFGCFSRIHKC